MVSLDDYRDAKGNVDWEAYRKAQVAAGEICRTCGAGMIARLPGPRECMDCRDLDDDQGEVTHAQRIRCPKCRQSFKVGEHDLYDLYEEGEHEVSCLNCEHEFEVSTSVSYSFRSPALEPENDEAAEEAAEQAEED